MKPSIPKGTRDFLPQQVNRRNYIFDIIRSVFVKYGYQSIETPVMENLSTLTGKYGEEGDRLLFKVLNNGDFLERIKNDELRPFMRWEEYYNVFAIAFRNLLLTISQREIEHSNGNLVWKKVAGEVEKIVDSFFETYYSLERDDIEIKAIKYFLKNRTEKFIIELRTLRKNSEKKTFRELSEKDIKNSPYFQDRSIKKKYEYFQKAELPRIKNFLISSTDLIPEISKRGLRYDLTVPFARFVVMYQNDLSFPFKRYQIQPVWRADRPQKGRYQEFYQCDVDVVGSDSLSYEAELVQIYDEVFGKLGVKTITRINNRKVLAGIAEVAGIPDQMVEMTVAIDKLDKIGLDGVVNELRQREIGETAIEQISSILEVKDLDALATALQSSETGMQGVEEIKTVFAYLEGYELSNQLQFDVTLARGLNYYTGCIFEVNVDTVAHPDVKMGSIGGGGRYADLTSVFGLKNMPGVGVSFGAERIYDVLEELELFPAEDSAALKVLFIAFDEKSHRYAFRCLNRLRAADINADLYPDPVKLKKQMKYANDRQVPFVILIGDNEIESGKLTFKNMQSGEQEQLTIETIMERLQ